MKTIITIFLNNFFYIVILPIILKRKSLFYARDTRLKLLIITQILLLIIFITPLILGQKWHFINYPFLIKNY